MNVLTPKILAVDDMVTNLNLLEKVLKHINVELVLATSGDEAIQKAREHHFALALLDVEMPKMDGYETANLLLKQGRNTDCPIIFITGAYQDEAHRLKGYNNGAVDYLEKPFNTTILLSKVNIFLKLYNQQFMLENIHKKLKQEFELSKKYRENLVIRLSETTLNKSDLVRNNARMIQEIAELNQENKKLHNYIENHLCNLEYN